MTPPEVVLDRIVRNELRHEGGCSGYSGKLNIDRIEPESLRFFLHLVQSTMNEALRLEGVNASAGVEHPPFHFDYLDVTDGTVNAHAFQRENFSFIVVTCPMIELLWHSSHALSRSPLIANPLRLNPEINLDALHGLLFQTQLDFLIAHEYTHHIHRHCDGSGNEVTHIWTELRRDNASGDINRQARELDADSYAAYIVLSHVLRGDRRNSALTDLCAAALPDIEADELLLTCYFLALLAFFCALWRGPADAASIYRLTHPPAPVRIKYAIQVAEMWCGQNGSVPSSWFVPARFQELFRAAAQLIAEPIPKTWDAQIEFLRSPEGARYDEQLFQAFEMLRHTPHGPAKKNAESRAASATDD
jgi:hypothetical protein